MDRRQFLAIAGSLSALSGCISSGDSGSTDTPESSNPGEDASETRSASQTATEPEVKRDTLSLGESTTLADAVEVSVTDATVARRIVGPERKAVSKDGLYVLAKISVRNVGDEPVPFPSPSSITALSGSKQFDIMSELNSAALGDPIALQEPIDGEVYSAPNEAHPGVEASGWLGFELPKQFSRVELGCSYKPTYSGEYGPVYWKLPVSPDEAPVLSIDEVRAPDSIAYGKPAPFEIVVSNTGGSEGTITRAHAFGESNNPIDSFSESISITVPPGTTTTETVEFSPKHLGTFFYAFGEHTASIEVKTATLSYGDTLTDAHGLEFRFEEPTFSDSYETQLGRETQTAPDGKKYAFSRIYLRNNTDQYLELIESPSLVADGAEYYMVTDFFEKLTDPVSGTWVDLSGRIESGTTEGWLMFEVDEGISAGDASIQLNHSEGPLAEWS